MAREILVIDRDFENYRQIEASLQDESTNVFYAATVQDGLQKMRENNFCLIIVDLLLSECGGHDIVVAMRERSPMPILALSEQSGTADKVRALQSGADDFLSKPYDMQECLARAQALMRRYMELNYITQRGYDPVCCESIVIDTARRMVSVAGQEVELTRKEYEMLLFFIKNRGLVLSYEQIYQAVWHDAYLGDNAPIFNHVRKLRKKLGVDGLFESVYGFGYKLRDSVIS